MGQQGFVLAYQWGEVSESLRDNSGVPRARLGIYHAIGKEEPDGRDKMAAAIVKQLKHGVYRTP